LTFSDFKKVDAAQIPHTFELKEPAFVSFATQLDSLKHNIKTDAKWFKKTK